MEDEKKNPIGWFIAGIILLVVVSVGLGFYLTHHKTEVKQAPITMQSAVSFFSPDIDYQTYVSFFKSYGVKKPVKTFIYNVESPEVQRNQVDPDYHDPYIGYEENQNLTAAIYKVSNGYVFLLYDTQTKAMVRVTKWDSNNTVATDIYVLKGKKALLTSEAIKETDPNPKQTLMKQIASDNQQLGELYSKLNQSAHIG